MIKGNAQNRMVSVGNDTLLVSPSRSLYDHSPDGFCLGYGGSGPAQLALALLLEFSRNADYALNHHQKFKWDIIAKLPIDSDFEIPEKTIDKWIENHP